MCPSKISRLSSHPHIPWMLYSVTQKYNLSSQPHLPWIYYRFDLLSRQNLLFITIVISVIDTIYWNTLESNLFLHYILLILCWTQTLIIFAAIAINKNFPDMIPHEYDVKIIRRDYQRTCAWRWKVSSIKLSTRSLGRIDLPASWINS